MSKSGILKLNCSWAVALKVSLPLQIDGILAFYEVFVYASRLKTCTYMHMEITQDRQYKAKHKVITLFWQVSQFKKLESKHSS